MSHATEDSQVYNTGILEILPKIAESDESETVNMQESIRVLGGQDEPTVKQRIKAVELSGAFNFWDRPGEDIYSLEDGEPI